jgi:hypothetical protein
LGLAAVGSAVVFVASGAFVVRMLKVFRSRGYISRHT